MIYVENKDLVIPGEVLADDEYYSGRGTFKENGKICSSLMGLVSLRNKKIRVIPLKSKYVPKKGDVVIGKIKDVRFSMWDVDINSPYSGILPAFEVFGREKKELNKVFDVGDVLFLRVVDVDEVKKVKLGLKGRGMGKFRGGIIVDITPTKVPRLIGKKGSMINMIKDKTNCKIIDGQNGLVWVKGEEDMEQLTKDIIHMIEAEAHTSGLTNKVKNKLYLAIDGELPQEDDYSDDYEELEKPKLQNFKEELEQEEKEEAAQPPKEVGFISVSVGKGMTEIFKELGVDYLIEGGQTMNPSTEDMLNAIAKVNAKTIYIFPNNKNIVLAANQARDLTEDKEIVVVPTKTIPQGITAMISYVPEQNSAENTEAMLQAIEHVKTGQITYAVRDTRIDDKEIHEGDMMGIGDHGILAVGKDRMEVAKETVAQMVDDESEVISIYYGADTEEAEAEELATALEEAYPDCDVELNAGGQPIYYYVISVE